MYIVYCIFFIYFVFTDFDDDKLSKIEYDEVITEFNHVYNSELLKAVKAIDKNAINCMN